MRQRDPTSSYQIKQSEIAIGSGQKTGQGTHASQAKENFLPVKTSDFVFASVGEIYGFVGAAIVLSLYALLMWRTLYASSPCPRTCTAR